MGRRSGWHICIRRTFKGVNHIREFDSITNEKYREIISHQIIVTILGIELDGKAADIACGIGRSSLAGDGRESREDVGALALRAKERRGGCDRGPLRP